jgi:hypothetical protein
MYRPLYRLKGECFFAEKSGTLRTWKVKGVTGMVHMSDEIQFFCPECHTPFLMGLDSLESGAAHICASCGQRIEFVDESFDFEEETPQDFPRPVLREWIH